jgi:leader peptidase (prepilin peptidase)/N-methyltransferase
MTPALLLALSGAVFGVIGGSFLNVLIQRLPGILERHDYRPSPLAVLEGLAWPASHCPCCSEAVAWRDNIPVLSYVVLRGRCRSCRAPYGVRYLAVELLSAAAGIYCALAYGLSFAALLAGIFILGLIALIFIDVAEQLLPNAVVFPLLGVAVLFNSLYGNGVVDSLLGGSMAFGALWLVRTLYRLYAGIEGLGYGDLKLAAALGAWLGLAAVPSLLFIAFAGGVAFMTPLLLTRRLTRRTAVPFGPFLAVSGLCLLTLPSLSGFPFNLVAG